MDHVSTVQGLFKRAGRLEPRDQSAFWGWLQQTADAHLVLLERLNKPDTVVVAPTLSPKPSVRTPAPAPKRSDAEIPPTVTPEVPQALVVETAVVPTAIVLPVSQPTKGVVSAEEIVKPVRNKRAAVSEPTQRRVTRASTRSPANASLEQKDSRGIKEKTEKKKQHKSDIAIIADKTGDTQTQVTPASARKRTADDSATQEVKKMRTTPPLITAPLAMFATPAPEATTKPNGAPASSKKTALAKQDDDDEDEDDDVQIIHHTLNHHTLNNGDFLATLDEMREFRNASEKNMWKTPLGRVLWDQSISPCLSFGQNREDKTHDLVMSVFFRTKSSSSGVGIRPAPPCGVLLPMVGTTGNGVCQLCHSTHVLSATFVLPDGKQLTCGSQCAARFDACMRLLAFLHQFRMGSSKHALLVASEDALRSQLARLRLQTARCCQVEKKATRAQLAGVFGDALREEARALVDSETLVSDEEESEDEMESPSDVEFVASEGSVTEYSDDDDEEYCDNQAKPSRRRRRR